MAELSYLGEDARRHDRDRFACALLAPAPARESLFALYAFDRELARIVESMREPMLARVRLQWWRESVSDIFAGRPPRHPVAEALAAAIRSQGLSRERFERLLDARDLEIDGPPADMADLIARAANASGAVTGLALEVLGARADAAAEAGDHVAVAWSLVEAVRAVPHHARRRRHFLPVASLRTAGLDAEVLFEGHPGAPLFAIVAEIALIARDRLARARALRREVPRGAVPALLPATLADVHLRRLERAGFDPFARLVQRPGGGRMRLLAAAWRGRY